MGNLNFIVYFFALVLAIFFSSTFSEAGTIGVNYGQDADNLPSPASVVQLLRNNSLNRVRIYDTDASVMRALSGSGIKVIVAVPNDQLASVTGDQNVANQWVGRNIKPYYPATEVIAIAVGEENLNLNLVQAMKNIQTALRNNSLPSTIKVSSPIGSSAIENSFPPSSGRFKGEVQAVIRPRLEFLRQTGSYLMVNIYPFYAYSSNSSRIALDYAVFRPNPGVVDSGNGLRYSNLFDSHVDAIYAAIAALGYDDLKLVVTWSGWPSKGDQFGANIPNAGAYNRNLVNRVLNGGGTPLKPNDALDVYIFALFNENQKGGATSERNFGLFYPNQQKVYPISFTGRGGVPSTNTTIIGGIPLHNGTIPGRGLPLRRKIMIGVFVGVGVIGGLILLFLLFFYRKNQMKNREKIMTNPKVEQFLETYGCLSLQRYKYKDIKKMTNSFKDKLGQGGYGSVFKGKLVDGRLVAVKVLINDPKKGNGEEFMNEVATIGRTNHINVVSLLGFCVSGSIRALVYEFMPNGSLEKFIYAKKEKSTTATTSEITNATTAINVVHPLGWEKLYQIALGIARGLEYLHRGCNTGRILHFDIKPHNILLDEKFCPKISDFGLAKLCPTRESIVSMHGGGRGTMGYIAPEVYCRNFGGVSYKSDVYSYGMMVLEMVGGRNNIDPFVDNTSEIYFPHWIYDHLEDQNDKIEDILRFEGEFEEEMARKMIIAGLWCVQTNPSNRPSMSRVSEMLEGKLEDLEMPPKPIVESVSPRASLVP